MFGTFVTNQNRTAPSGAHTSTKVHQPPFILIDTSHLKTPGIFHQELYIIPKKKLRENTLCCHVKENEEVFLDPCLYQDLHHKLTESVLG